MLVFALLAGIALCLGLVIKTDWQSRRIYLAPVSGVAVLGMAFQGLFGAGIWLSLLGAVAGVCLVGASYLMSRRKGIGSGDIWLAGAVGLAVGYPAIVFVIAGSAVVGLCVILALVATKQIQRTDSLPLGAMLAIGTLVSLLSYLP